MAKLVKKEEPTLLWSDDGSHLKKKKKAEVAFDPKDTLLRIRTEKKGRGGKSVTVIYQLPDNPTYFKKLSKRLKSRCATGGSYKGDSIEIQGEVAKIVEQLLKEEGFQVKISGG